MVRYSEDMSTVRESMLHGFFVGWPTAPSPAHHLEVLRGSFRAVVAVEEPPERVVGFATMISDGVLTAFVPWLEVLPTHQAQGIGTELMSRILRGTDHFYSIDVVCDRSLVSFYTRRFGMREASSAVLRRPAAMVEDPPVRRTSG